MSIESKQNINDLCKRLFDTLSEVTDLEITHYNQFLRGFFDNNLDFDDINLERMQSKGIDPNRVTCILIIDWLCQKGSLKSPKKIVEHIKCKDMAITKLTRSHVM